MIGKLRHRVTFQSRSRVSDGAGGNTISWSAGTTVWAKLKPMKPGQAVIAGEVSSPVSHVCRIRHGSVTVTHDMRMVYGGNNYNVRGSINVDEMNHWDDVYVDIDRPT